MHSLKLIPGALRAREAVDSTTDTVGSRVERLPIPHPSYTHPLKISTLEQAQEAIQADDAGKWDIAVRCDELSFRDGQLAFPATGGNETRLGLTPWATGQFCARLGIPLGYFRRCPPILQEQQAGFWLRHVVKDARAYDITDRMSSDGARRNGYVGSGEAMKGHVNAAAPVGTARRQEAREARWLLRAKHGDLRAILSEHYSPLDNVLLMQSLRVLLGDHYRVDWLGLSPESLHLRIIDPRKTREVLPDDALTVGVHIANSEVGFRCVTVDALVFRLVCANGLVKLVKGKSLLRQRHIHLDQPHFLNALEEAVSDAFLTADSFIDELRRTTREPVPHVEETIEQLSERWKLSEKVQDDIKTALARDIPQNQQSLYGLVNAITATAQHMPDESRYDMEVLAGQLAEYGVPAYAPRRKAGVRILDRESTANASPRSGVALAQEMFEAEIVGSVLANESRPAIKGIGV